MAPERPRRLNRFQITCIKSYVKGPVGPMNKGREAFMIRGRKARGVKNISNEKQPERRYCISNC